MGFKARKKSKVLTEEKVQVIEYLAQEVSDFASMMEGAANTLETYLDRECPDYRNYFNDTFNRCSAASEFVEQELREFEDDTAGVRGRTEA